jgi:hypothetical protein
LINFDKLLINNNLKPIKTIPALVKKQSMEKRVHVSHKGSFEIDYPSEKALRLFTVEGERLWIPGWEPEILRGDGYHRNDIFISVGPGGRSTYVVIEYDDKNYHALYARVTPDITAGTVEITITPHARGSLVEVGYNFTSLSTEGNESLSKLTDEAFAQQMISWKNGIESAKEKIADWFEYNVHVPGNETESRGQQS